MAVRKEEKDFEVILKETKRIYQGAEVLVKGAINKDPQNIHLKNTYKGLEQVGKKLTEQNFQVAVLALVKSGKSTLINALIGGQYLPSSNAPETARIVRIRHQSGNGPSLTDGNSRVATGVKDIHSHLRLLNAAVRQRGSAPSEDELILSAPLACLDGKSMGEYKFEVLDTPGPNEAGTDILQEKVNRLLDDVDVIIYLLDYTKLKTKEEKKLFERLSSMRPELLKRFSERLFFIVNKIDLQNSRGLSQEKTQQYVADLLSKQVNGLQVSPERVLLVSAELGLLARLVAGGHADCGVVRDFAKHAFGILAEGKTIEDCKPFAEAILDQSKLTSLEESILSFIYKKRSQLFLQIILDDLQRHLSMFQNYLMTASKSLKMNIDELKRKASQIEQELETATSEFNNIHSLASSAAGEIERWIRDKFSQFQRGIEQELNSAFEQRPKVNQPHGGIFRKVLENVKQIFIGLRAESKSDSDHTQRVNKLNQTIAMGLKNEFSAFQGELEQEVLDRQKMLFEKLELALSPLARRIEDTLNKQLNISLNPVSIQIPRWSIDELHDKIQGRINKFIERQTRSEVYQTKERYLKKQGGWCSPDEYEYRPVTKEREVEIYSVNAEALYESWHSEISKMTDASVKTARHIIKLEVEAIIKQARSEIENYREGYGQTLNSSLDTAEKGKQEREDRLKTVEQDIHRLRKYQQALQKCCQYLEAPA